MARVLVAEADALFRDMIEAMLVRAGHTVRCTGAESGCLDLLARERFHLVVADLQLPGPERRNRLSAICAAADPVPVIGLAAEAGAIRATGLSQGGGLAAVVAKPFWNGELLTVVEQVLARRAVARIAAC